MAKKHGLLAELHYQSQQAERRKLQAGQQAYREQQQRQREYEKAVKDWERAQGLAAKATTAERKAAEAAAKQARVAAQEAEVAERNAALANTFAEIDGLLQATLAVDDFVDLEELRQQVEHPPFPHPELESSTPPPQAPQPPSVPVWEEPPSSGGLFGKKKHAEQVAAARQAFEAAYAAWEQHIVDLQRWEQQARAHWEEGERYRLARLEEARAGYTAECAQREQQVEEANASLDELIAGLAYGVDSTVQEYVAIVLANSAYPDSFPVSHDHVFDAATGELTLTVSIPGPTEVPSVKAWRYTKATDAITPTPLPAREHKDRYANAVLHVALRTLHEVFEADRSGHIRTVATTVGTTALDPATGRDGFVPLALVAADRETFMSFDLANVVPAATLKHLGGVMSRSPVDLVAVDTGAAVRGRN